MLIANGAEAMFMMPDLEAVPIGRALMNLERFHKNEPSNAIWLYALARVHSMAYATNLTEIPWDKRDHTPYYGYGSDSGAPTIIMLASKTNRYPDWHEIGDPRDYFAKRAPTDKTNALPTPQQCHFLFSAGVQGCFRGHQYE
jgi:hypothetical protein